MTVGQLVAVIQLGKEAERIDATHEVQRRLDLKGMAFARTQIEKRLAEIEADVLPKYPAALAFAQMSLEAWRDSLRWVLKILEGGE